MQWILAKVLILFLSGTISTLPTLFGTFVFDDGEAIVKNSLVTNQNESIAKIFYHDFWGVKLTHPKSHKSYRPFTTFTYRLDYYLWGENAVPFHLQNILIHGINCCLVYFFLEKCLKYAINNVDKTYQELAFWSALLFSVHPVHVEPVGGLVGRADLLSSFVFLLAFILIGERWRNSLTVFCAILGSLFKENAIVLSAFTIAVDILVKHKTVFLPRRQILGYFISIFLTGTFVLWRLRFQGGAPVFQNYDNPPAFADSIFTKISSIVYIWGLNAFTLINPIWLCYDWSGNCVSLIETVSDFRFLLTVGFAISCCKLAYTCFKNNVIMVSVLIMGVTFLPSSNLIFVVGFVLAERNLYLPSIGSSLIVAYAVMKKGNLKILFYIILIFFGRSIQRSYEWIDQPSLFKAGLKVCPTNAKVHYNLGTMFAESGDTESAEKSYKTAIHLRSDYYQAMNNLGNILRDKNSHEAEFWLRKAVDLKYDFAAAWMNLGIVLSKRNRTEALDCYQKALRFRKFYPDCEYNLGNLYLDMGNQQLALKSWEKATMLKPQHEQSWINSVILYEQNGELEKAKELGQKALTIVKNCDALHFILGNILGKLAEYEKAQMHFEMAINICQNGKKSIPAKYFTNLGVLFHRWNKKELAMKAYLRALEIDPLSESAKKNLRLISDN